jgi:hypothetical protein
MIRRPIIKFSFIHKKIGAFKALTTILGWINPKFGEEAVLS